MSDELSAGDAETHNLAAGEVPSLLDSIQSEIADDTSSKTRTMRVGRVKRLSATYRALVDEERDAITERAKAKRKLAKRVGKDLGLALETETAAETVALACMQLLWTDDHGVDQPLHELLGRDEPMRFNAETLQLLAPAQYEQLKSRGDGREPSSAEVAKVLHEERHEGKVSLQPLRTVGSLLQVWMSGVSTDALEETLEGN